MYKLIELMLEEHAIYELIKRLSDHEKLMLANELKGTNKRIESILLELDDVNGLEYLTDAEVEEFEKNRHKELVIHEFIPELEALLIKHNVRLMSGGTFEIKSGKLYVDNTTIKGEGKIKMGKGAER